jgi:hypothetical protein
VYTGFNNSLEIPGTPQPRFFRGSWVDRRASGRRLLTDRDPGGWIGEAS